jgi:hypothetical protein
VAISAAQIAAVWQRLLNLTNAIGADIKLLKAIAFPPVFFEGDNSSLSPQAPPSGATSVRCYLIGGGGGGGGGKRGNGTEASWGGGGGGAGGVTVVDFKLSEVASLTGQAVSGLRFEITTGVGGSGGGGSPAEPAFGGTAGGIGGTSTLSVFDAATPAVKLPLATAAGGFGGMGGSKNLSGGGAGGVGGLYAGGNGGSAAPGATTVTPAGTTGGGGGGGNRTAAGVLSLGNVGGCSPGVVLRTNTPAAQSTPSTPALRRLPGAGGGICP